MVSLKDYGWNDFHQLNYNRSNHPNERVGRVISLKGFKHQLISEHGEVEAELSGKMLYGVDSEDLPKVGDWVCFLDYGDTGYIIERLPRQNMLSRKTPGKKTDRQVLGANIDYAIVVQGLDRDFNPMRLDRYIAQIIACGITPVVVLNKVDLVDNTDPYVQRVSELKRNVTVYCCSTFNGTGIAEMRSVFERGKTYMMIGSSGVGKSSLVNLFNEVDSQHTAEVSDFNGRGKHTTTARELFLLPNGSLLMDTPGMREFGLTSEEGNESDVFPAIDELAIHCHYGDCSHMMEKGCAVLNALEHGELDTAIYESYVKLVKEQRRFEIRAEDKKRINRQFGKMVKEAKENRRKWKY